MLLIYGYMESISLHVVWQCQIKLFNMFGKTGKVIIQINFLQVRRHLYNYQACHALGAPVSCTPLRDPWPQDYNIIYIKRFITDFSMVEVPEIFIDGECIDAYNISPNVSATATVLCNDRGIKFMPLEISAERKLKCWWGYYSSEKRIFDAIPIWFKSISQVSLPSSMYFQSFLNFLKLSIPNSEIPQNKRLFRA